MKKPQVKGRQLETLLEGEPFCGYGFCKIKDCSDRWGEQRKVHACGIRG
jgi:hypothetical protein